jgi:outer membrane protein OmpA-like peptidoglycan-associated protein
MKIFQPSKLALAIALSGVLAGTCAYAQVNRDQEQSNWENRELQQDSTTTAQQESRYNRDDDQSADNQPRQPLSQATDQQQTAREDMDTEDKKVIAFEFDSSELSSDAKQKLKDMVADLDTESATVKVTGYTDTSGPEVYNEHLAKQRAETVEKYLKDEGIENIEVEAAGEADPVASNDTREGRQQNRRVEVTLASADGIDNSDV